jgi:hypothetical protein
MAAQSHKTRFLIFGVLALSSVGRLGLTTGLLCLAGGALLGVVISFGYRWWAKSHDREVAQREPGPGYVGLAYFPTDGLRNAGLLTEALASVRHDRAGLANMGGGSRGVLRIRPEGVAWTPTPGSQKKGFRQWAIAWAQIAGIEMIHRQPSWFGQEALVLTFRDGSFVTLLGIQTRLLRSALGDLEAVIPGQVPQGAPAPGPWAVPPGAWHGAGGVAG